MSSLLSSNVIHYVSKRGISKSSIIAASSSSSSSSSSNDTTSTHFGFTTINKSDKEDAVASIFTSVASKYDLMNDFMSMGIHRLWKDHLVQTVLSLPATLDAMETAKGVKEGGRPYNHLDVAGGE
jgi:2-methoxy-6-polyprenyl-1,4-benzoquinol methylase